MNDLFGDRLADAVRRVGNPVLVGLDPRWENLPEVFRAGNEPDPAGQARGYREFCRAVIDVVAPLVAAVKPQAAFFEQLGPAGMLALKDTIDHARARGLLVVLDAKRNDIGSTATAYAQAYLGPDTPWGADALTVSPYLGEDSLQPFVDVATPAGAGLFVLVKTSNPGGGLLQDLPTEGGPVYRRVAGLVERLAEQSAGRSGYGVVGAVAGATYPQQLAELRASLPHAWLLVPGFGAQGGSAQDVAGAFDEAGLGAIVNNSRGLIFAHERREYRDRFGSRWEAAVEAATRAMIDQLRSETRAGRLAYQ